MVQEFETSARIRTGGKFEKHMYYRRPRDADEEAGWLIIAGTNAARIEDMVARGFEPLYTYGTIEDWERQKGIQVSTIGPLGPWQPLFDRGGAKEFPVEQVVTARWYKETPVPGKDPRDLFPQLKGQKIKELQCPACKHPAFHKISYLASHLQISHNWSLEKVFQYGERSGLNFDEIYVHQEKEYSFGEAVASPDCDECDYVVPAESKNKAASLRMHKLGAHKPFEVESA